MESIEKYNSNFADLFRGFSSCSSRKATLARHATDLVAVRAATTLVALSWRAIRQSANATQPNKFLMPPLRVSAIAARQV